MTPLEALVVACERDDVARVQQCMAACVAHHVEINDTIKETLLIVACSHRHLEVVEYLLQCGADVHAYHGASSATALHCAIHGTGANLDIINLLLVHGASVEVTYDGQETALHAAMGYTFNRELVELLLEAGADATATIKGGRLSGYTPLHQACHNTNLFGAEFLLRHGVDVNARDINGTTPLRIATAHNYHSSVPLMKLLLQCGADSNAVDAHGDSILQSHLFRSRLDVKVLRLLFNYGALAVDDPKRPILHTLVRVERPSELLDLLLENGIQINALNTSGDTALHVACSTGRLPPGNAEYLLTRGAQDALALANARGYLPFHCAAEKIPTGRPVDNVEFLRVLLKYGADINATTRDGLSPLSLLLHSSRIHKEGELSTLRFLYECVRLMCSLGAVWDNSCENRLALMERLINSSQDRDIRYTTSENGSVMFALSTQVESVVAAWNREEASDPGSNVSPALLLSGMRVCIQHWVEQRTRGGKDVELTEIPTEVYCRGDASVNKWLRGLEHHADVQQSRLD